LEGGKGEEVGKRGPDLKIGYILAGKRPDLRRDHSNILETEMGKKE